MATTMDDRIEQERAFHDDRYRNDPRAAQDKFYEGLGESEGRFAELVARFQPGDRVLELGCGIDSLAFALAERGVDVVGIDISPVAVEKATAEAETRGLTNASFRAMNAEALDFEDASFDGVIGTAVLHHLDVASACSEMGRVLRPNGRAVFIEPLGHNPVINWYRNRTPEARTEHEHPLRWADYALAQRFFEEVQVETFHLFAILTSPIAGRAWGRPLHRLTTAVDRRVLAVKERVRWQAWIAVSEFRRPR
jgi:SAM-dependent methyltransferase